MLAERKLTLELTPEAKKLLAEDGYDPAFGARPLKRSIQRMVQNPLAMAILDGRFTDGDQILATVGPEGELKFEKAGAPVAAGHAAE